MSNEFSNNNVENLSSSFVLKDDAIKNIFSTTENDFNLELKNKFLIEASIKKIKDSFSELKPKINSIDNSILENVNEKEFIEEVFSSSNKIESGKLNKVKNIFVEYLALNRNSLEDSVNSELKNLFSKAENNFDDSDLIKRPSINYWKDVFQRFLKNKLAIIGIIIMTLILIMAIIGPSLSKHDFAYQNYDSMQTPPDNRFWFGTDDLGRDIFTRLWLGTRVSLFIGVMAALSDFFFGVVIGGIAGYKGGVIDDILMRFGEILYSIPYMLMVVLLMVLFEPGVTTMILAMAFTGWVPMSRLVRGEVLKLKELDYVHASMSFGAKTKWILTKHLVPNAMGPIIVNMTLTVPRAIFAEATLSFVGLGLPAPQSSLGVMTSNAQNAFAIGVYYELFFPALVICLLMFSFNVIGDGLRDALDPKLRK